jgi:hypothetical protein
LAGAAGAGVVAGAVGAASDFGAAQPGPSFAAHDGSEELQLEHESLLLEQEPQLEPELQQ